MEHRMRTQLLFITVLVVAVVVCSVGFQCGSTEITSAKLYLQRSDWDNAIRSLEAELAKNPKNEEAWYWLGVAKGQKSDFQGMNDAFDNALKIGQTYAKDIYGIRYNFWGKYLNLGVDNFNNSKKGDLKIGETKDEVTQFLGPPDTVENTATEFGATEQWLYSKLDLKAYFDQNVLKGWQESNKPVSTSGQANVFLDEAIAAFKTSIVISPDSAAGYKNLGFCYLSKDDMGDALGALEKSFAMSNDRVSGRYIGEINYQIGRSHKEKFESPENTIEIRIWMTPDEVKAKLGEPTSKSSTKEKKITKEKWVYDSKKLALNFEDGQLRSWEENGKKQEREPWVCYKDSTERDSAMVYFDRSINVLERVLKLDPHNADLIGLLSNVYIAADKGETALEVFKEGVEADPKNKYFHYNYGVLLLKDTQFQNAIDQFQAALALDSTYETALYNLGVSYVNWGVQIRESSPDPSKVEAAYKEKFKLALPHLEKMTKLKPDDPESWELLGRVYANLGMSKEATAVFQKADKLREKK
jgi:tetratricopeptide (TPR) repeat protein